MIARTRPMLAAVPPSMHGQLIRFVMQSLAADVPPAPARLAGALLEAPDFDAIVADAAWPFLPTLRSAKFTPAPEYAGLDIPRLETEGDVASWLGLSINHLEWLADLRRNHAAAAGPALYHYRYRFLDKRHGAPRLLEAPKPALKAIQRRLLREILDAVPPPAHAHGFVRGRSVLTGAQLHAGEAVVVALDLAHFFPTVPLIAVHRLYRRLGYPWSVARLLTGLSTTITPGSVFLAEPLDWQTRQLYAVPHLAQGAPTSPALANFAAAGLDRRLAGLARRVDANYSRYADDLTFSGDAAFASLVPAFLRSVDGIVRDEGFSLNPAKTRVMPQAMRQTVTGIVVNRHCNLDRTTFDALKATLHDCVLNGPSAANRSEHPDFRRHLDGRVSWAEQLNPQRGLKLRRLFERIEWDEPAGCLPDLDSPVDEPYD